MAKGTEMYSSVSRLILLALLVTTVSGCQSTMSGRRIARTEHRDVLYSPNWSGLATYNVARSQWPATAAPYRLGEVVDYEITTYDEQGRSFSNQDGYLRRRFSSVRSGRTYSQ